MTTIVVPLCLGCKHYRRDASTIACDAFPDGIPDGIWTSETDHRQPFPGDHGIRFEAGTPADARYAIDLFGLFAFDPNQPRRSDGKWGSKGGAAGTFVKPSGEGDIGGQLGVPDDMADLNEIGQQAILDRAASLDQACRAAGYGKFPKTPEEMAIELEKTLDMATPEEFAAGSRWYQDVHDEFADRAAKAGVTADQAYGAVAVCSPLREWDGNAEIGRRMLTVHGEDRPFTVTQELLDARKAKDPQGRGVEGVEAGKTYKPSELTGEQLALVHPALQGFGSVNGATQVDRAFRILRGQDTPDAGIGGTKVRNFYNNIRRPDDPHSVTIDSWQVRAMTEPHTRKVPKGAVGKDGSVKAWEDSREASIQFATGSPSSKKGGLESGVGMYPMYGAAIHLVAQKRGMVPQQVQAITWLVYRDRDQKRGKS